MFFRLGTEPPGTTEEQIWYAKKLYSSAFHPDTGEKMNVVGRMSFQVPGGMLITGCLLQFYKWVCFLIIFFIQTSELSKFWFMFFWQKLLIIVIYIFNGRFLRINILLLSNKEQVFFIIRCSIFCRTIPQVVFWQWVNQSFNAFVNYTNRNAKSTITNKWVYIL